MENSSKNITKLSATELQKGLENALSQLSGWGSIHYVEEINRRVQNRLTMWLVITAVVSTLATVANVWITLMYSCR